MSEKYSIDDILNEVKLMQSGKVFLEEKPEQAKQKTITRPETKVRFSESSTEKPLQADINKPEPLKQNNPELKSSDEEILEESKTAEHKNQEKIDYSKMNSDDFFKMIEKNSEEKIVGGFKVRLNNEENQPKVEDLKKESDQAPQINNVEKDTIIQKTTPVHKISADDNIFKKPNLDLETTNSEDNIKDKTMIFDTAEILKEINEKPVLTDESSEDIIDSGISLKSSSFKESHKPDHVLSPSEIKANQMNETVRFKLNDTVIDLSKKKTSNKLDSSTSIEEIPETPKNDNNDLDFGFFAPDHKAEVENIENDKAFTKDITYTDDGEKPENKHEAFARKTKRKVDNHQFNYSEEKNENNDVIDDYCNIEDAESVEYDLNISSKKLSKRLFLTVICLIFSGLITLLPIAGTTIGFVSPAENVNSYLIANAVILLIAVAVNINSFFRGLGALFTFKPDVDSALSVATLAAIIQSGVAFAFPQIVSSKNIPMFSAVAIAAAMFNIMGKKNMISRIKSNFKFVASTTVKQSCFVADDRMGEILEQDDFIGTPTVACSKSVINLQNYLYNSYCEDPSDNICKTFAPIGLLASLAILIVSYFTTKDIMISVSSFAAVATISVPASALLSANLPLKKAAKKIKEKGGLLTGYDAVNEFCNVDCVTVNSEELFPAGAVELLSLRAIGEISIEDVILKSAALTINAGGPLADVFDKIIDGRRKMLPPVLDMFYEDGLGLTGNIEGKTVRIGNRSFMDAYGIYGLSDEAIDEKARRNGSFIVYTAIDDEVCGMFAVKYKSVDPDIEECIYNLVRNGITVAVKSNDPNVTPELIGKIFDIPSEYIVVMAAHIVEHYDEITKPAQNGDSIIAHNNNISVFASILITCKKLRVKTLIAVILQTVLTIVGFGITMLYTVTGDNFQTVNPANIILFQIICTIVVLFIPSLIKRIK